MTKFTRKSTEQWVELIAEKELPAITSTARLLDSFANDDVSSLPKLSKAILHDQALSSCILKVANNIAHIGHSKVTTVSRASVVLGIHAVKNICMTSKLLEGLLKSQNLGPKVYDKITRLMATSFYSGMIAKMMVPEYDEDTQEEVYLAAMLYRIGETAFWSCAGEITEEVIDYDTKDEAAFSQHCFERLGTTFSDLSTGLAKQWELGDLLEKSLDQPETRSIEMQIIYLADKLARYIDNPPSSAQAFNEVLEGIAKIKKINVRQLKRQLASTRELARDMMGNLGVSMLKDLIKPLPTIEDFKQEEISEEIEEISQERAQLNAVMELTKLAQKSKDINDFLMLALECTALNLRFERSVFFMMTTDKNSLKARISLDRFGMNDHQKAQISLNNTENIFSYVVKSGKSVLINDHKGLQWRNFISAEVESFVNNGSICLAPVNIGGNIIGIVVGQHFEKLKKISEDDFQQFCFLIEHLNMCLSMVTRR